MSTAISALLVYIGVIVGWNAVLKRNIGEAMLLGFVAVCALGGSAFTDIVLAGVRAAFTEEVVFVALAFVFMGFLLNRLGFINEQVSLLNAVFGRFRGGAGYVSTSAAALLGCAAGSGAGIASSVGSVTIPWMSRSNWSPELAATLVAGNAGLGISIPPSSSMFLLLGAAAVAPVLSARELFLAAFVGGMWTVVYRFLVVFIWVRLYDIQPMPRTQLPRLRRALREGWASLLVYLGIAVPLFLTTESGMEFLVARVGAAANEIDFVLWIPVTTILMALLLGMRRLPRTLAEGNAFLGELAPRYATIGATLFAAFAAAGALGELGLVQDLTVLMAQIQAPKAVVALLVGVLMILIAAPLTGTATIVAVGGVCFTALTAANVPAAVAATAILVFASTEGASPPGAAPIYIACAIANVDPARIFLKLILWFVLPLLAIGVAIATQLLPVPAGA